MLGISAEVWTVIMMAVAGGLALAMIITRRDIAYALVVIWALVGIAVLYGAVSLVAGGAVVTSVIIAVGLAWLILQRIRRPMTPARA